MAKAPSKASQRVALVLQTSKVYAGDMQLRRGALVLATPPIAEKLVAQRRARAATPADVEAAEVMVELG